MQNMLNRRQVLKSSMGGLLWAALPGDRALAQTALRQRLDWNTFKAGPNYASFLDAIKKMRANTNASDKNSWLYWTNIHVNYCPHGLPYFLAWHRGYINYFEKQLCAVSGNANLTLPYWNYYTSPALPAEFTDSSSTNPLYVPRTNNNVLQALTLAPFSNGLTALPRGTANAFEPSLEDMPHNPVHDIIGGIMADMQSPMDPIFWLHHANIDRLWAAWVAAANGRLMPARTAAYWTGTFTYSDTLTLARLSTYGNRTDLSYFYQNEAMPLVLPVSRSGASTAPATEALEAARPGDAVAPAAQGATLPRVPRRPPFGRFPATGMRTIAADRLALAGASQVALDDTSVSARLSLSRAAYGVLRQVLAQLITDPFGAATKSAQPYSAVNLVLDTPLAVSSGAKGGYFYKIYVNLPSDGGADDDEKYLLGTVGPFQLAGLQHHATMGHGGALQLSYPATTLVQRFGLEELADISISFVRISGDSAPAGQVITIKECRLEVAAETPS
jgi:tyrosinase